MVGERPCRSVRNEPPDSSPTVACKRHWRRARPAREGSRVVGCPGCLYLSARPTRLSHLHVSPRPLYVARVGSPTVDSRSQYGGAYGRRYVCRLCYLAERSPTAWSALKGMKDEG